MKPFFYKLNPIAPLASYLKPIIYKLMLGSEIKNRNFFSSFVLSYLHAFTHALDAHNFFARNYYSSAFIYIWIYIIKSDIYCECVVHNFLYQNVVFYKMKLNPFFTYIHYNFEEKSFMGLFGHLDDLNMSGIKNYAWYKHALPKKSIKPRGNILDPDIGIWQTTSSPARRIYVNACLLAPCEVLSATPTTWCRGPSWWPP